MCIDGRNGLLIPPGDEAELAASCLRLLREPGLAERMGGQGREVARERYDIRTQAARLCDLYRRAMAR
jgi:glycosyltransferase involved in cell wall biosynthesis